MRLIASLCLLLLISGCSQTADHGPVSGRTQARLEALAVPKEAFIRRLAVRQTTPDWNVSIPLRLKHGVPVIQATINGPGAVPMMVDTGASRTMIQAAMAVEKKVPVLRAEDATVEMQGVVGREKGRIGLLDPLVLGGWALNGYPCLVRTYENRSANARGAQAFPESLLGFDVALRNCKYLTLDYRTKIITFGFRESFRAPSGKRVAQTPFTVKHGVPFIKVSSGGKSWEAIVDTGSFNGIEISEDVAAILKVQDQGVVVRGLYLMAVGGTVSSAQAKLRTVKLPDLTLVGDRYKGVEVDISPGPPRVGSFFLKDYRVTFDFSRKRLWLEW